MSQIWEEQEQSIGRELKRVEEKQKDGLIMFQDLEGIEKYLVVLQQSQSFMEYLKQYSILAHKYLRKVVSSSDKNYLNQSTKVTYSYFLDESLKIVNKPYYPFLDYLIELNFVNFMDGLHQNITNLEIQHLIEQDKLCNLQCIGCNKFYYQFLPIQLNIKKRNYQLIFINNSQANKPNSINLQTQERVYPDQGKRVDLSNIEHDFSLLEQIIDILNNKGGFIMIGCKRIQEFGSLRQSFTYAQRMVKFMHTYFVMGQCITQQVEYTIRRGLQRLLENRPQIKMGENVQIQFIPVVPSPFKLNFKLQQIKLGLPTFKQRNLHVVLIKINPTQPKYAEFNGQSTKYLSTDLLEKNFNELERIKLFMDFINIEQTQESNNYNLMLTNQLSYFNRHQDCNTFINLN